MTRPIGPIVADWCAAPRPDALTLKGRFAELKVVDAACDTAPLWAQFEGHDWVWDYLFDHPPQDFATFERIIAANAAKGDQPCYVIADTQDKSPLGYACFLAVVPENGTIEIGNVNLSPALQRTPIATEAFFLMIDWAFANGYRRMEWKCNALNAPSRKAAQRLGFSYEGVFRNHSVLKGRSRDTAWFAITDADWPMLRTAFTAWLAPENFNTDGQQIKPLGPMTARGLFQTDPTQT